MRDLSRAWSRFYRQSEQVMWSGIPSGSSRGVNPSPEKPLTAFDRSRIPVLELELNFLAFRGVGDGRIRRLVPRSDPFLPPLHHLLCQDSSPVAYPKPFSSPVRLRGATSIVGGDISG